MPAKSKAQQKAAGLAELWIVEATSHVTHVLRQPGPQGYGEAAVIPFAEPLRALCLPGASLRLSDLLA